MEQHAPKGQHAGHVGDQPAGVFHDLQARHLANLPVAEVDGGILALIEGFSPVADRVVHPDAALLLGLRRAVGEGHVRRIVAGRLAGRVVDPPHVVEPHAVGLQGPAKPQGEPPRHASDLDGIALVGGSGHEDPPLVVEELRDEVRAEVATRAPLDELHVGRGDVGLRGGAPFRRPTRREPLPPQACGGGIGGHRAHADDAGVGEVGDHANIKRQRFDRDRLAVNAGSEESARDGGYPIVGGIGRVDDREFRLVGAVGDAGGLSFDERDPLLDLPIAEGKLADHQEADGHVDQHVAAADPEHHHQADEEHDRGHARLDQLPHDAEPRIVHPPGVATEQREAHDGGHRHRPAPQASGHQPLTAVPGGRGQPYGEHGPAALHHPPHGVVVDRRPALEAVGAVAGENHADRQQGSEQRDDRAPDEPPSGGRDIKPRRLGGKQVDQHHEPDRPAPWKRKPAGQVGFPEHRHGRKIRKRYPRQPAVEVFSLHFGKVLLVLSERANQQQERRCEEHHHGDLERAQGPEQLPGDAPWRCRLESRPTGACAGKGKTV